MLAINDAIPNLTVTR